MKYNIYHAMPSKTAKAKSKKAKSKTSKAKPPSRDAYEKKDAKTLEKLIEEHRNQRVGLGRDLDYHLTRILDKKVKSSVTEARKALAELMACEKQYRYILSSYRKKM